MSPDELTPLQRRLIDDLRAILRESGATVPPGLGNLQTHVIFAEAINRAWKKAPRMIIEVGEVRDGEVLVLHGYGPERPEGEFNGDTVPLAAFTEPEM